MVTMAEDEQGKGDHVPIVEHQARGGGEMCAELLSMRCTLHRIFPFRTGCSFILWKRDVGVKGPKFREEFDWRLGQNINLQASTGKGKVPDGLLAPQVPSGEEQGFLVTAIQQQQALMVPLLRAWHGLCTPCLPQPAAVLHGP